MKSGTSGFTVWIKSGILLLLVLLLASCNAPTQSEPSSATTSTTSGTTGAAVTVANIALTATPSTITTSQTSSIQATVTDSTGNYVADGTSVSFSVSNGAYGTVTSSATTASGIATATFTALSVPGTVTITAASGSVSNTVAVVISQPENGSIAFVSASPQVLGIKGSGQASTSTVTFAVKDVNGNAAVDGVTVNFTMNGPSGGKLPEDGGEYIGDLDDSPTTATSSTVSGNATVILNTGSVAGTVTITASVTSEGQTLSASSGAVSIGGGVPSATHFSIATNIINIDGFSYYNRQTTLSVFLADRFGNYNVLEGTSVSFYTEGGAVDNSNTVDETGVTSVTLRSQEPMPEDVTRASAAGTISNAYFSGANEPYYTSGSVTYNPRDGWVTVLSTVQGEEAFADDNGNGLFDASYNTTACPVGYTCQCSGGNSSVTGPSSCANGSTRSEGFIDLGEPFYDKNDDGARNDGSVSGSPFEEYIDANGNGQYDGANGVWDGPSCDTSGCLTSKTIWKEIKQVFSYDNPVFYPSPNSNNCYNCNSFASGSFAVAPTSIDAGSSGNFGIYYGDLNLNMLEAGATVAGSVSAPSGSTSYNVTNISIVSPLPDGLSRGPSYFEFNVSAPTCPSDSSIIVTATVTTAREITSSVSTSVPINVGDLTIGTDSTLPAGTVGEAYNQTLTATGGTSPYYWYKTAGSLPSGLALDSSGNITGTPTTAGTYTFTIKVYDSCSYSASASKAFSLTINQ